MAAVAARAQTLTTLHFFNGGGDGYDPEGGVIVVGKSNPILYGTTYMGGSSCNEGYCGTIFSVNVTTGAETLLRIFSGQDGALPQGGVTLAGSALYGTTGVGGDGNPAAGVVFKLSPSTERYRLIHNFGENTSDGAYPLSSLIDVGGTFYGTTEAGGAGGCGCGTVFQFKGRSESVLYSFTGGMNGSTDGAVPYAGLIYHGGLLYGTTDEGGLAFGTVFSVNPTTGAETVQYQFQGGADGERPDFGVIYQSGMLYGTTFLGGTSCRDNGTCGTVFRINLATGAKSVLHRFTGGNDGELPSGGVIYQGGALYGMTSQGGTFDNGTIFKINPNTGAETILYNFDGCSGCSDGSYPSSGLTYKNGVFYGTTVNSVFEFVP